MEEYGKKMFALGCLFMGGLSIMAQAIHWFITPAAYTSSQGRIAAVAVQAAVGLGLAVYAFVCYRRQIAGNGPGNSQPAGRSYTLGLTPRSSPTGAGQLSA